MKRTFVGIALRGLKVTIKLGLVAISDYLNKGFYNQLRFNVFAVIGVVTNSSGVCSNVLSFLVYFKVLLLLCLF